MIFYKAIHPSGRSFHLPVIHTSGPVRWGVGRITRHPGRGMPIEDRQALDPLGHPLPSRYLSVADVPTDCTGFRWPCRLFEVEPADEPIWRPSAHLHGAARLPHKWASAAWYVRRELPAHEVFGPQGEEVVEFIDRVHVIHRYGMGGGPVMADDLLGLANRYGREAAAQALLSSLLTVDHRYYQEVADESEAIVFHAAVATMLRDVAPDWLVQRTKDDYEYVTTFSNTLP